MKKDMNEQEKSRFTYHKIFHDEDIAWFCPKCKEGLMRRHDEKDRNGGEELAYLCWKCDNCGEEEYEPFD